MFSSEGEGSGSQSSRAGRGDYESREQGTLWSRVFVVEWSQFCLETITLHSGHVTPLLGQDWCSEQSPCHGAEWLLSCYRRLTTTLVLQREGKN